MTPRDPLRLCLAVLALGWIVALGIFLFHDVKTNPQYDTQVINYAYDMAFAVKNMHPVDFLSHSRKYPLLYVTPFAALYAPIFLTNGPPVPALIHFLGRLLTAATGVGTVFVLWRIAKRLRVSPLAAVALLLSSVLFFLFSTAIRPHVPLTFWNTLTLLLSLCYDDDRTWKKGFLAFGAAVIAAGTLQNGFLALVFPLWAQWGGRVTRRSAFSLVLAPIAAIGITILLAYPSFVFGLFGSGDAQADATLGHDVGLQFLPSHLPFVAQRLIGSEFFLMLFAIAGAAVLGKERAWTRGFWPAIGLYLFGYFLVFGTHSISDGRFFIVTLPFFALLGAVAFGKMPRAAQAAFFLLFALIPLRFAILGARQNTIEQASALVVEKEGRLGTGGVPVAFFSIPPPYFAGTVEAVTMAMLSDTRAGDMGEGWTPCGSFVSSRTSKDNVLLWVDTPWALYHLFMAERLGPNLRAYCKE